MMNRSNGLIDVYANDRIGHPAREKVADDFVDAAVTICSPTVAIMSGLMSEGLVERIHETGNVDAFSTATSAVFLGLTGLCLHLTNRMGRDGLTTFSEVLDTIDGHY